MPAAPTARSLRARVILLPQGGPTRVQRLGLVAFALFTIGLLGTVVALIALPRRDQLPSPAPRIVIALGAGVRDDSTLTSTSATRLETAIAYARAHDASLVTTRVYGNDGKSSDRAQRLMITGAGLADRWIALPSRVGNTRDEALAMHMVIADSQPIVVVTSPLHTRRACATFERVGYDVTCIASANHAWWRLPYAAVYELAALVKYRMRHWA